MGQDFSPFNGSHKSLILFAVDETTLRYSIGQRTYQSLYAMSWGAYPLRYLNFCVTDVSGVCSGNHRGQHYLSFEIRAECIRTIKIFQKVTQILRYLRGC